MLSGKLKKRMRERRIGLKQSRGQWEMCPRWETDWDELPVEESAAERS